MRVFICGDVDVITKLNWFSDMFWFCFESMNTNMHHALICAYRISFHATHVSN
jgi:hypothetical protein